MSKLLYNAPAVEWEEALPIGNGRMGAMIYGGAAGEHLQLNEESIWYGGKMDRDNPDTLINLPRIRELLLGGRISEDAPRARIHTRRSGTCTLIS